MVAQDEYYAWFYEGSQWTTYAGGVLMVALMLGGVMFPLWPPTMRLGVWYLSMGMLGLIGLFFATAIVRLIFYIITVVVASPGIWIFPKLFADVGFVSWFYLMVFRALRDRPGRIVYSSLGMGHAQEEVEEEKGREGRERREGQVEFSQKQRWSLYRGSRGFW